MTIFKPRILFIAAFVIGSLAFSSLVMSMNASAAGLSGTWGSRIPGEGYMQTYIGPYGNIVTDYFDIELELTESGGAVSGTLRAWNSGNSQTFDVWGTLSGSTFYMTADYGWDGVSYLTPTYTLTIEGNQMYGSGSYVNAGVPITGTFDLEKQSLFGFGDMGDIAPVVSSVSITISIIAIVIAVSPGKAPKAGFQPQTTRVPSPTPRYEPSQQWTTELPPEPVSGDGTVPVGGAGLSSGQPYVPATVKPSPPAEHFTKSQVSPRCPVHGDVALVPHYFKNDGTDKGSWFCPKCNSYPWGRN